MKFIGDIIITDPCYICKDNDLPRDYSTQPEEEDFGILQYPPMDRNNYKEWFEEYTRISEHNKPLLNAFYAAHEAWRKQYTGDWEKCAYGDNMEVLGFTTYLTNSTLYGDWSCTTVNKDTDEPIGEFCADAGLVSVFLLEEVMKYNPEYDGITRSPHSVTLIKDFDGDVEIVEDDFGNGEIEVRVIGTGNVNFYTTQTGL